ncbi:lyase family protein [Leifsonia sp. Root112D2]|uniref:lyase family protein n=1 Tax=Leifsonia sp. Root112D2 TaxID=1736426 RepID=UPI0006F235A6|nr:lyase family protein [Leifsonia sp. Root112D2]KQV06440.1 hypothetical protein ASC63_03070 [Leifsonia sp. Root112D2]
MEGVGGRLSRGKSAAYRGVISRVEARAVPYLARYMVATDLVYLMAASDAGSPDTPQRRELLAVLVDLLPDGGELITTGLDLDLLTLREAWLIDRVGPDVAGHLHLGRNRTESLKQYLPRLFFRELLAQQRVALLRLITTLRRLGEEHRDVPMPVYHHLQHAMVSTLGEYLLSWATNLVPHVERLDQVDHRLDLAPSINNERPELKRLADGVWPRLGFTRVARLRHQQHATEDQFFEPMFALEATSVAIARLAEDLRLWMTSEFDLFALDDSDAAGSSGLPQKKNPFGFQAIIGGASVGAGRLAAQLTTSIAPSEGLESAFQAASLYEAATDAVSHTVFIEEVLDSGRFNLDELERKAYWGEALMSEACDMLVFEQNVPFRMAHHELGALVRARLEGGDVPDVVAALEGRLGRSLDLTTDDVVAVLDSHRIPDFNWQRASVTRALIELDEFLAGQSDSAVVSEAIAAIEAEARRRVAG